MTLGALGEGALRLAAKLDDLLQAGLDLAACRARLGDLVLGGREPDAARAQGVAGEQPAGFEDLALEALMELGALRPGA